jgi:molybdate transport system substrate-binding protein
MKGAFPVSGRIPRPRPVATAVVLALLSSFVLVAATWAGPAPGARRAQITVYAAASLTNVFPQIDPSERYSFGGSNTLAAQIALGAPADVFASANMTLPNQLFAKGLCSRPVVFTRNTLVIVVPKGNPASIHNVYDLAKPGVKIDVAGPGVPVGSYTLQILKNMNLSAAVLANVVSQETDVREVLAKVALSEVDAGFVYSTDAKTAPGQIAVLKVPAWAQPKVQYGICVVSSSADKADAQAFVNTALGKAAQAKLVAAGFLPRVRPTVRAK